MQWPSGNCVYQICSGSRCTELVMARGSDLDHAPEERVLIQGIRGRLECEQVLNLGADHPGCSR